MKKISIFFGRFQPAHNGHVQVIKHALESTEHIIILMGSSEEKRTIRNPFDRDRAELYLSSLLLENGIRRSSYTILHLKDYTYNELKWQAVARSKVNDIINSKFGECEVYLTGFKKDGSSYYLSMFPEWKELPYKVFYHHLSSTLIRDSIYDNTFIGSSYENEVSSRFKSDYDQIYLELKHLYDSTNFDSDIKLVQNIVVLSSGHILLTKTDNPNSPTSLIEADIIKSETLEQSALINLHNISNIRLTDNILLARKEREDIFDDPYRVNGQRVISATTFFKLNDNIKLPKVSDNCIWEPLYKVKRNLKDDHFHIIKFYTGY